MNLNDRLTKVKHNHQQLAEPVLVTQALNPQLLLPAHDGDSRAMNTVIALQLDHIEKRQAIESADTIRTLKIEEKYKCAAFTVEQLKEMANLYNLRFLNTGEYNGLVPKNIGHVINNFIEERNLKVHPDLIYFLAPEECFNDYDNAPRKNIDLMVFYRATEQTESSKRYGNGEDKLCNDIFMHVQTWGCNFTDSRVMRILLDAYTRNDTEVTALSTSVTAACIAGVGLLCALSGSFIFSTMLF